MFVVIDGRGKRAEGYQTEAMRERSLRRVCEEICRRKRNAKCSKQFQASWKQILKTAKKMKGMWERK